MKKILIASLALLTAMFVSCNKAEVASDTATRTVRISASAADLVGKVASSTSGRFTWQKNDAIGVWTGAGLTKFTLDPEWDGYGYGEFVGELPSGGVIGADSYAVYPYADGLQATATSCTFGSISKWELPASNYLLYAKGATEVNGKYTFSFHHATAYFRVTLKNIPAMAGGLYIETADGGCYATSATLDVSGAEPALSYTADESVIYPLPEHKGVIEQVNLIIAIKPGTYAQNYASGGLKFRIAVYSEPNWWSTKLADHAGIFGKNEGFTINAGDYFVFPEITYPNAKQPDDSGSGVNDGIEESIVNVQDPDGYWTISLN